MRAPHARENRVGAGSGEVCAEPSRTPVASQPAGDRVGGHVSHLANRQFRPAALFRLAQHRQHQQQVDRRFPIHHFGGRPPSCSGRSASPARLPDDRRPNQPLRPRGQKLGVLSTDQGAKWRDHQRGHRTTHTEHRLCEARYQWRSDSRCQRTRGPKAAECGLQWFGRLRLRSSDQYRFLPPARLVGAGRPSAPIVAGASAIVS